MKHKLLAFLIVTFIAANLSCTNNKGTRVTLFADPNLEQAVIDAIKTTDPAYSATDVKVADCQKLITLDASNRGITDVAGIQYCSNLQALYLGSNKLKSLPAGAFTGMANLRALDLSNNGLTSLPVGAFTGLTNLWELDLDGNELKSLPVSIFTGLTSLEDLKLNGNQLTSLPAGVFTGLTSLEGLDLSGNELTSLPAGIFSGLTNLRELNLFRNPLTNVPASAFMGMPKGSMIMISGYLGPEIMNRLKKDGVEVGFESFEWEP